MKRRDLLECLVGRVFVGRVFVGRVFVGRVFGVAIEGLDRVL